MSPSTTRPSKSQAQATPANHGRQTIRLGDVLVQNGILTATQRDQVLAAQKVRGGPFGVIAEEMYGIHVDDIERAWAQQYASLCTPIDPRRRLVQPEVLRVIDRRQAWQFRVLPIEFEGDWLLACTTVQHLPRALKFTAWKLGHSVQFVIAEPSHLGEAMVEHYPMAGMTPDVIAAGIAAA